MEELVKLAIQGDADAFIEIMERNTSAMYKVARGILENDADIADAIQETILSCFEKIGNLKQPAYFKTWMTKILINECMQILRHYKRVHLPGDMPEKKAEDMSMAEFEFQEMLNLVDEKYRLILILYYVQGFKIAEIAQILELNENTVKSRLVKAREQIKAEYSEKKAVLHRYVEPGRNFV